MGTEVLVVMVLAAVAFRTQTCALCLYVVLRSVLLCVVLSVLVYGLRLVERLPPVVRVVVAVAV